MIFNKTEKKSYQVDILWIANNWFWSQISSWHLLRSSVENCDIAMAKFLPVLSHFLCEWCFSAFIFIITTTKIVIELQLGIFHFSKKCCLWVDTGTD